MIGPGTRGRQGKELKISIGSLTLNPNAVEGKGAPPFVEEKDSFLSSDDLSEAEKKDISL